MRNLVNVILGAELFDRRAGDANQAQCFEISILSLNYILYHFKHNNYFKGMAPMQDVKRDADSIEWATVQQTVFYWIPHIISFFQ